ncbi:unnamed protein product [Rotaria magnacalcarata]|uniref:Uncharacterized protein n=2 Tax=Rotaria magnacalcarata TaxID=392030 RepID=A0A816VAH7_9BILA|nr:unnamed protein product [Rotaria magnacalcarata]CAF1593880.1 unnamed protein product [Rotaria magnacalcarata]CAF2025074.1 unnamed protein product [Rotaria magnacalcarata]CAF2082151.1 unnamed protein product [Rotaria magnacalcarata]CAF2117594.1 unnamed protein product [Rotaria magnacalcarata]
MHCDIRLLIVNFLFITKFICFCQYSDEQSYLSLIEFNRGGPSTSVIISSPHGGFLGSDFTSKKSGKTSVHGTLAEPLSPLPIGGCYNNTLDRCVYSLRDCLRSDNDDTDKITFHPDARCIMDRSSTSTMYALAKAIAEEFLAERRPFTILNKLTRQYVDPAEDLDVGTFLLESSTRVYMDYHRFISMAKESIRPRSHGLFIEFVFHKNSQTIQLGYGFEPSPSSMVSKPSQSTITDLVSRFGSSVIKGNNSLGYFLHRNGFPHVIPLEQQRQIKYRLSTHSTRTHADQRFNAILFSYPIERLRTHTLKLEAIRITKAIEQFIEMNHIKSDSASSFLFANSITILLLFLSQIFFS